MKETQQEEKISFIRSGDWTATGQWLESLQLDGSQFFLLTDRHVRHHCFPRLVQKLPQLEAAPLLEIAPGEARKSLESCLYIWEGLSRLGADRSAILINLGGGVVCDLGGFAASVYLRGIRWVHLPTSLLAQVDAAIGGKTGVNLGELKNHVGSFGRALATVIDPGFLTSLPYEELLSGYAELVKTALVADAGLWEAIKAGPAGPPRYQESWISRAALLKAAIAGEDFREAGRRKALNFGHTYGHVLESYFLQRGNPILHGLAVAEGMRFASQLSVTTGVLDAGEGERILEFLTGIFPRIPIPRAAIPELLSLMGHDKKSKQGQVRFTLLKKPGHPLVDQPLEESVLLEALQAL